MIEENTFKLYIRVEITDEIPTVNSQKRRYTVNLYRQS